MVRKKILDSQYKCFEKMNRHPAYNKTGRRHTWKSPSRFPPFSVFTSVPPQVPTAAATGTDGCAGMTRQRAPTRPKTAPTTLWTLTPQVAGYTPTFLLRPGEKNPRQSGIKSVFFSLSERATKYCGEDGQWFRHPDTNRTWSNYTLCNENTKAKLKVSPLSSGRSRYFLTITSPTQQSDKTHEKVPKLFKVFLR